MSISPEKEQAAKSRFRKIVENLRQSDIQMAIDGGSKKLMELGGNAPQALRDFWGDIKLMLALLTDYGKGEYREIPWKSIASITGAVIYFVLPIDSLPDFIPVAGYLDDAVILKLVVDMFAEDLKQYSAWKELQKTTPFED